MKKWILILCIPLCSLPAWGYKIEGNLTHIPDTVLLRVTTWMGRTGWSSQIPDTVVNGKFLIEEQMDVELQAVTLRLYPLGEKENSGKASERKIWVTPEATVRIQGEGMRQENWEIVSSVREQEVADQLFQAEWEGESENDLPEAGANSLWGSEILRKQWTVIEANPDHPAVWAELDGKQQRIPKKELENLYGKMSAETRQTKVGEGIWAALNPSPLVEVGQCFRDFEAVDREGVKHKLSDYAGKGEKYLLLDFWFAACGACHGAIPGMKAYYEKYKDKLDIIAINADENDKMWEIGSNMMKVPWMNWSDQKGMSAGVNELYRVRAYPTYVLIDPEGKIIKIESYHTVMAEYLENLLGDHQ